MQEQRRQHRLGDRITPVEGPVEAIERAVERKRERAEEGDAQPEEMQRRLIVRPAQPDPGADQQREEADRRQDEVHRPRRRDRRQRHVEGTLIAKPQQRVGEPRAFPGEMLVLEDFRARFDRIAVDGDQDIAALDSCLSRGGIGRHLGRRNALGPVRPEHAVFHFMQPRAGRDVGDAERHQDGRNEAYGRRT